MASNTGCRLVGELDRLVGEGLEQRNLLVRKHPPLAPRDGDHANGLAFTNHRHRDQRPIAETARDSLTGVVRRIVRRIRDVDDDASENRLGGRRLSSRGRWKDGI